MNHAKGVYVPISKRDFRKVHGTNIGYAEYVKRIEKENVKPIKKLAKQKVMI